MKIKMLILSVAIGLMGCSANQKFDCPMSGGVRCQSLSEVDSLIDSGKIDEPLTKANLRVNDRAPCSVTKLATNVQIKDKVSSFSAWRTQEEVIQIWLAGYESEEGIYHHPSTLNVLLKPSKWIEPKAGESVS